ncbi:MAG: 3-hydroxybutyrate dehydrogenase, partial [Pseudomonadota bacterium]|nr:3-hydroxybutyrate dehydrogenase [Pseudomonadota bacterium]
GIGLAIAHALAKEGCNILLNGIADKQAVTALINELQQTYQIRADYSPADMSKPHDISDMVAMCERVFGRTDILVNNAGIQFTAPVENFPDDKWDAIIAINLSASFHAIKAALPGMKKRGFGRIVNIASVHGLVASENKAAYVSAKHGLVGLTKVVALENAETPVTCNAICPGWVHTPLVQKQIEDKAKAENIDVDKATAELLGEKEPSKRFTHPEDIAAFAVYLCGDSAANITGSAFTLDGGWTAQ